MQARTASPRHRVAISATNAIETNYLSYYNLYYSYASHQFEPTNATDQVNLRNLVNLCPGTDGACVYQARALYNAVYNEAVIYPVCTGSGARMSHFTYPQNEISSPITVYPNPATNKLTVKSDFENEQLGIVLTDLSGRTLLVKSLKLSGFIAILDLDLLNGAYLITLTRSDDSQIIKKLLIAR